MFDPVDWITKHPYTSAGIGVVILVGAYLILSGSSSSSATTGSDTSTQDAQLEDAELSAYEQQQSITAQTNAATAQYNAQLALDNQNNASAQALAQIQANSQGYNETVAAQVADTTAQYQYELGVQQSYNNLSADQIQAQTAQSSISSQETVSLAQLQTEQNINDTIQDAAVTEDQQNDAAQVGIAQIVGQTQQAISANQTQVGIEEAKVAGQESGNSLIGGIASGLIAAVL